MNELVTIKNVRGYIDEKGTAFLNLEDVARGLGIEKVDVKNGIEYKRINKQLLKKWLIEFGIMNSESDLPEFIPENIFYKLCMKANNETARRFQDLVCDEILPSIRKTGSYSVNIPKTYSEALFEAAKLAQAKEEAEKLAIERKETIDMLVHENKLYTATEIAKELGFKSAVLLNNKLEDMKIQYKVNGSWVLYSNYSNLGYISLKQNVLDNGKIVYDRKWTGEGRKFLLNLFSSKMSK